MSGPLKQVITQARGRLLGYLTDAENYLAAPKTDEVKGDLEELKLRIGRVIALIDKQNELWSGIIARASADEKDDVTADYEDWVAPGDSFIKVADQAREALDKIEASLRRWPSQPSSPRNEWALEGHGMEGRVQLPKVSLPSFSGDPLSWDSFWQQFEAMVGSSQSLPAIQKLSYLLSCLKDEARREVLGYPVLGENYRVVVDVLKARFGKPEARVEALTAELLKLPAATDDTASLRRASEAMDRICRQLEALGRDDKSEFVALTVKSKLPTSVMTKLVELERVDMKTNGGIRWSVAQWRSNLKEIIDIREEVERSAKLGKHKSTEHDGRQADRRSGKELKSKTFAVKQMSDRRSEKSCLFCEKQHDSKACPEFSTGKKKTDRLRQLGRCLKCLSPQHRARDCKSARKCNVCDRESHHWLVCWQADERKPAPRAAAGKKPRRQQQSRREVAKEPVKTTMTAAITQSAGGGDAACAPTQCQWVMDSTSDEVLLMAAKVTVTGEDENQETQALLLLDSGSQMSYIKRQLAIQLGLQPLDQGSDVAAAVFNGGRATRFRSYLYRAKVRRADGDWEELILHSTPKITEEIHSTSVTSAKEIIDISTRMKTILEESEVEPTMLIGIADFWRFIVKVEERQPGIYLVETIVGPMICGASQMAALRGDAAATLVTVQSNHVMEDDDVHRFWSLEGIGVTEDPGEKADALAMAHFNRTVKVVDGRYAVRWPWKEAEPQLASNRGLCEARLLSSWKRWEREPSYVEGYDSVFREYATNQVIERAPKKSTGLVVYYMPHHCVRTPKPRIVFDGGSHVPGQSSLNDNLYRGYVLLPQLAGMVLRFRLPRVVVIGDLMKAFLQLELQEEDRDSTRFLWVRDLSKPPTRDNIEEWRFRRVPFGVVSSPFLLAATILHHLGRYARGELSVAGAHGPGTDPDTIALATEIAQNTYVDNVLLGAESPEEASRKLFRAKALFASASMRLRDFLSNASEVNEAVPEEDRLNKTQPKMLGISWDSSGDELQLHFKFRSASVASRRKVLKEMASTYDPMGLLAPSLLEPKLFFQSLWAEGTSWDSPLSAEQSSQWTAIAEARQGRVVSLPRRVLETKEALQLHCFVDASKLAFASAVYVRTGFDPGPMMANLLFSKSRLAPAKGLTIPRLEMMAILIGVRSLSFVQTELGCPVDRKVIWSDSQCALRWVSSCSDETRFVTNRLTEIRQHRDVEFRFVRTDQNPADLGTRGVPPDELKGLTLWWHGPAWLSLPDTAWPDELEVKPPAETREDQEIEATPDVKTTSMTTLAKTKRARVRTTEVPTKEMTVDFARFSNWTRLLHTVTYLLHFAKKSSEPVELLAKAETVLIRLHQTEEPVEPKDSDRRKYFKDENGLVRVRTRIGKCGLGRDFVSPIVLRSGSWFTALLIRHIHIRLNHSGVDSTLTEFLTRFWCRSTRLTVRLALDQCLLCWRITVGPFAYPEAYDLPRERVTECRVFGRVGIDFLGPTLVRNTEGKAVKSYILLITCLVSRAVHLEPTLDLSARTFLMAFRKFCARRGQPEFVYSDNGSYFTLARSTIEIGFRELVNQPECRDYMNDHQIRWLFIPALSPWQGGVYERLVALVKDSFKKTLWRVVLPWDEFQVFAVEVEATLNHRPLTQVSDEAGEARPLRPIDLVHPGAWVPFLPIEARNPEDYVEKPRDSRAALLEGWKVSLARVDAFWERWRRGYLLLLRERTQWTKKQPRATTDVIPTPGAVVLISEEGLPRNLWRMGVIQECPISGDGAIRSARVRVIRDHSSQNKNLPLPTTVLHRPISRLYPLEIPEMEQDLVKKGAETPADAATVKEKTPAATAMKAMGDPVDGKTFGEGLASATSSDKRRDPERSGVTRLLSHKAEGKMTAAGKSAGSERAPGTSSDKSRGESNSHDGPTLRPRHKYNLRPRVPKGLVSLMVLMVTGGPEPNEDASLEDVVLDPGNLRPASHGTEVTTSPRAEAIEPGEAGPNYTVEPTPRSESEPCPSMGMLARVAAAVATVVPGCPTGCWATGLLGRIAGCLAGSEDRPPDIGLVTKALSVFMLPGGHSLQDRVWRTTPQVQPVMLDPRTLLPAENCPLPALELPKFDGSTLSWRTWWSVFSVTVDQRPLTEAYKWAYLISCLEGRARAIVDSSVSDYPSALRCLWEAFDPTSPGYWTRLASGVTSRGATSGQPGRMESNREGDDCLPAKETALNCLARVLLVLMIPGTSRDTASEGSPPAKKRRWVRNFSGDLKEWPQFWVEFDEHVHSRDFPKWKKHMLLISLLEGDAYEAVVDYTTEQYDWAVHVLQETYERQCPAPAPKLYRFCGNRDEWRTWWEGFAFHIHSQEYSTELKFALLWAQTGGRARDLMRGLRLQEDYKEAVGRLWAHYGAPPLHLRKEGGKQDSSEPETGPGLAQSLTGLLISFLPVGLMPLAPVWLGALMVASGSRWAELDEPDHETTTSSRNRRSLWPFDGNRAEWHAFWRTFERETSGLPDSQKLIQLTRLLGDQPMAVVQEAGPVADYQLAVAKLKSYYGRAHIPKLPVFGGAEDWAPWWNSFRMLVHETRKPTDFKYALLRLHLRDAPRELVEAYPPNEYRLAVAALKRSYDAPPGYSPLRREGPGSSVAQPDPGQRTNRETEPRHGVVYVSAHVIDDSSDSDSAPVTEAHERATSCDENVNVVSRANGFRNWWTCAILGIPPSQAELLAAEASPKIVELVTDDMGVHAREWTATDSGKPGMSGKPQLSLQAVNEIRGHLDLPQTDSIRPEKREWTLVKKGPSARAPDVCGFPLKPNRFAPLTWLVTVLMLPMLPFAARRQQPRCELCERNGHWATHCAEHSDWTSRWNRIHFLGKCVACLRSGHQAPACRSSRRCRICRTGRHHDCVCPWNPGFRAIGPAQPSQEEEEQRQIWERYCTIKEDWNREARSILPLREAGVRDPRGWRSNTARARAPTGRSLSVARWFEERLRGTRSSLSGPRREVTPAGPSTSRQSRWRTPPDSPRASGCRCVRCTRQLGAGLLLITLISLVCCASATANTEVGRCPECLVGCSERGVEATAPKYVQKIELCCETSLGQLCTVADHGEASLELPFADLVVGHECEVTFHYKGPQKPLHIHTHCRPKDPCQVLKCTWCWQAFKNPHCNPALSGAVGTVVVIVGLALTCCLWTLLKALCATMCCLGRCLYWVVTRTRLRRKRPRVSRTRRNKEKDEEPLIERPTPSPFRFRSQLPGWIVILAILGVPLVHSCARTLSIQANTLSCLRSANGTMACQMDHSLSLTVLPAGQTICLLMTDSESRLLGTLKVTAHSISTQCVRVSRGFTPAYRMAVNTSHRCPTEGACRGDYCAHVKPRTLVPERELADANRFPGTSFCLKACEMLECTPVCGLPTYSCLFGRAYPYRLTAQTFEYVGCDGWTYRLRLSVVFEDQEFLKRGRLDLSPAATANWEGMEFTLLTVTQAPIPITEVAFVTDGVRVAIADRKRPQLRCASARDAAKLQCHVPDGTCTCRPTLDASGFTVATCECVDEDLETVLGDTRKVLPLSTSTYTLRHDGGEIFAETQAAFQLHVRVDRRLTLVSDEAACEVRPLDLTGCYSCSTGAQFTFECAASFGEPQAWVRCNSVEFTEPCTPGQHSVLLPFNYSDVTENCVVECPGGRSMFQLKGWLAYEADTESIREALVSQTEDTGATGSWSLPGLGPIGRTLGDLANGVKEAIDLWLGWRLMILIGALFLLIGLLPALSPLRLVRGVLVRLMILTLLLGLLGRAEGVNHYGADPTAMTAMQTEAAPPPVSSSTLAVPIAVPEKKLQDQSERDKKKPQDQQERDEKKLKKHKKRRHPPSSSESSTSSGDESSSVYSEPRAYRKKFKRDVSPSPERHHHRRRHQRRHRHHRQRLPSSSSSSSPPPAKKGAEKEERPVDSPAAATSGDNDIQQSPRMVVDAGEEEKSANNRAEQASESKPADQEQNVAAEPTPAELKNMLEAMPEFEIAVSRDEYEAALEVVDRELVARKAKESAKKASGSSTKRGSCPPHLVPYQFKSSRTEQEKAEAKKQLTAKKSTQQRDRREAMRAQAARSAQAQRELEKVLGPPIETQATTKARKRAARAAEAQQELKQVSGRLAKKMDRIKISATPAEPASNEEEKEKDPRVAKALDLLGDLIGEVVARKRLRPLFHVTCRRLLDLCEEVDLEEARKAKADRDGSAPSTSTMNRPGGGSAAESKAPSTSTTPTRLATGGGPTTPQGETLGPGVSPIGDKGC